MAKFRSIQDHKKDAQQTIISLIGLVCLVLIGVKVFTAEQGAQIQATLTDLVPKVADIIAGVVLLYNLIFKQSTPPTV